MMSQFFLLAVVALGSSFAYAASGSDYECFRDAGVGEICMVIPNDAPETLSLELAAKTSSPAKPQVMMISENELSGGASSLVNEFSLETFVATEPTVATALTSQESLRWIETFLKTGPSSQSDDIFVRPANRTPTSGRD